MSIFESIILGLTPKTRELVRGFRSDLADVSKSDARLFEEIIISVWREFKKEGWETAFAALKRNEEQHSGL